MENRENGLIDYLTRLNRSIKVKQLGDVCGYSEWTIRTILSTGEVSNRQHKRIMDSLVKWIEDVVDGIQDIHSPEETVD